MQPVLLGTPMTRRLKDARALYGTDEGLRAVLLGAQNLFGRKGLLGFNLLQADACVDTDGQGRVDLQYNFVPFATGVPGQPPLGFHAVQVHPITTRPKSRGRLALASADLRFEPRTLAHQKILIRCDVTCACRRRFLRKLN
jgi:choline dehydrogenase